MLLLTGAQILGRDVHDAVGVDVEGNLNLGHTPAGGGDAIRDTAYIKTADTANNAWTLETVQTVE